MPAQDTTEYNGHTNYATWATNLWISNDEGTYYRTYEAETEAADERDRVEAVREAAASVWNSRQPAGLHADVKMDWQTFVREVDWSTVTVL